MYIYLDQEYFDDEKPELDDYLEHYGVIGMRWGVRRANKQANRAYKTAAKARTGKLKPKPKSEADRDFQRRVAYLNAANAHQISSAANMRVFNAYSKKAEKAKQKGNLTKYNKYTNKAKPYGYSAWSSSDAADFWASLASDTIKQMNAKKSKGEKKSTLVGQKVVRDVVVKGTFGKTKLKNLDVETYYIDYFKNKKELKREEKDQSKAYRKPVKLTQYTK